jgi:hypothetical protein
MDMPRLIDGLLVILLLLELFNLPALLRNKMNKGNSTRSSEDEC